MSVTEEQIKSLTPQHRIVWHQPPGQPVEMGLYVNEGGHLLTDVRNAVRYGDGVGTAWALKHIVRIIPPAFVPRRGLVIGKPGDLAARLVHTGEGFGHVWLGHAPGPGGKISGWWFTDDDARTLIESCGWEVMDDLAAPGEVTDAQVEAAAKVLAKHYGSHEHSAWVDEAREALEAAREVSGD